MTFLLKYWQSPYKKRRHILILVIVLALFVFLKNAWVAEDAYINFRSIEQLYAGNGPVWNPHERVQVYTSPLWYWLLASLRIVSENLYLLTIFLSLFLFLLTLLKLRNLFPEPEAFLFSVMMLTASTAFFDFTSSGLENGLAYLLLVLYYQLFLSISEEDLEALAIKKKFNCLLFLFGLLLLTRHDLLLLSLPPLFYTVKRFRRLYSVSQWTRKFLIGIAPFLLFTLFAIVYYGFPFPNTAYAKLNTGIPRSELLQQGGKYLLSSLRHDTMTLTVMALALFFAFRPGGRLQGRAMAWGVLLNLLYVVYVGGDFMQGRFLSFSFLGCVILLGLQFDSMKKTGKRIVYLAVAAYLVLFPHTPFNSGFYYENTRIEDGIADERGFYFNDLSLLSFMLRSPGEPFPMHRYADRGRMASRKPDKVVSERNIGIMGYLTGTNKIIVDELALGDPLLARLPAVSGWRIGHFSRDVPEGYIGSLECDGNNIVEDRLKQYYEKIRRVTQDQELLSKNRFKAIVELNFLFVNFHAFDMALPSTRSR